MTIPDAHFDRIDRMGRLLNHASVIHEPEKIDLQNGSYFWVVMPFD